MLLCHMISSVWFSLVVCGGSDSVSTPWPPGVPCALRRSLMALWVEGVGTTEGLALKTGADMLWVVHVERGSFL